MATELRRYWHSLRWVLYTPPEELEVHKTGTGITSYVNSQCMMVGNAGDGVEVVQVVEVGLNDDVKGHLKHIDWDGWVVCVRHIDANLSIVIIIANSYVQELASCLSHLRQNASCEPLKLWRMTVRMLMMRSTTGRNTSRMGAMLSCLTVTTLTPFGMMMVVVDCGVIGFSPCLCSCLWHFSGHEDSLLVVPPL